MLKDDVRLQRAEDGRIAVFDARDKFYASFKNGRWEATVLFSGQELKEFTLIEDEEQIAKVLKEAHEALYLLDFVLLRRADDGRISLFDARDKFQASFKNEHWIQALIFSDYALDDFTIIEDVTEIARILHEARKALGVPLENTLTKSEP